MHFRRLACGLAAASLLAPPLRAQQEIEISVRDYRYTPATVTIRVGDAVRWTNHEKRTSHSVLVDGEAQSERFFPGESWRRVFTRPGRYAYRCGPHPEMQGEILVEP